MFFRSNFGALELQIVQYIYNAVGKFLRHRKQSLPMPLFLGVAERRGHATARSAFTCIALRARR